MAESQCPFCKKSAAEERDRVGKTFRKDGVMVHQYCLVNHVRSLPRAR